jgi:GNAT superfamily N-acetyltransferase
MVTIKEITFQEMFNFMSHRRGYKVKENKNEIHWGAFVKQRLERLVGSCTLQKLDYHKSTVVFKHDYVRVKYRRFGIYDKLFAHRIVWCYENNIKFIYTKCSKASLGTYLRWGFETVPDWPKLQPVVAEVDKMKYF